MNWLRRLLDQFRRPQITVVNVGQFVIMNGATYAVRTTGLVRMPVKNDVELGGNYDRYCEPDL